MARINEFARKITGSKRTEMIKSALAVYHWFMRQAILGSQVVARKPTGEEVTLETGELTPWKASVTALARKNWAC